MILTKENINEWKKELDEIMQEYVPVDHKYSDCNPDEWWLENYEGDDTKSAKDDDLYYSSQN